MDKKRLLLLIGIFVLMIIFSNYVESADPGHGADVISSGVFGGSGNYTFPSSILPDLNNTYQLGNNTNARWRYIAVTTLDVLVFTNKISYSSLILTNSIITGDIVDRAVTSIKIALNSITADHIQANSINNSAILDNSINGSKIQNNAINASQANIPVCSGTDKLTRASGNSYLTCAVDATGASSPILQDEFNGSVRNINTSSSGIIIVSNGVGEDNQNITIELNLTNFTQTYIFNYNGSRAFNQSIELTNSYLTTWINQTKSIIDDFARYWRNNTLDILGLRNRWTGENNFTNQVNFQGNVNGTGNTTVQNLTITDLKSCNLDTDANGHLICGTDATGAGAGFSNAISNLTGLTSSDGRINFSGSNNPDNNVSITLRLNNDVPFNVTFLNYDKNNYNFTLSDLFNYNISTVLLGMTNTWTVQQTFNINTIIFNASITNDLTVFGNTKLYNTTIYGNLTMDGGNQTFVGNNSCSVWGSGKASICYNSSSLIIKVN